MSSPAEARDPRADEVRAACAVIASLRDGDALADADIQALLGAAVRLYAACAEREPPLEAFRADAGITATEAMVATTAILRAVNVQLFELGMWQAWSRR
jgi:hypothetical protein